MSRRFLNPARLLLLSTPLLLVGCATPARSGMSAALAYVQAVEDADPAQLGRTVASSFKYLAPRPGRDQGQVELSREFTQSAFKGLADYGFPAIHSVRVEEREEQGALDVYFRMEVAARRDKAESSSASFKLEGRWRVAVAEKEGVWHVTQVEEFPTRSDNASLALVMALHAGILRPLTPGACKPAPCDGREFLDPSGRVFFRETWRLTPDGGQVPGSQRFLDPEGRPFRNFTPAER